MSGECDVVDPTSWRICWTRGGYSSTYARSKNTAPGPPGGIDAPLDTLRGRIGDVGPGPFVVYCQVGQRGHTATMLLHELGVQARNLDGGYMTWRAAAAAMAGDPGRLSRSAVPA